MHPYLLTALAMLAFAANSILCRLALVEGADGSHIDAASFTAIRLVSGAVMLALIVLLRGQLPKPTGIRLLPVVLLFAYAICFSFSYVNIATGTGALILFGAVQLTMIVNGMHKGERQGYLAWTGTVCALAGLVYLLLPGISAPPVISALLMLVAGLSWGLYSIAGIGGGNPLLTTCWNFIGTLPLVLLTLFFVHGVFHGELLLSGRGIVLAVLSGAIASGIGYAIWYRALPFLSSTRAATVQLTVPIIAASGGVLLLAEPVTARLVIASIAVLGGVYLTIRSR